MFERGKTTDSVVQAPEPWGAYLWGSIPDTPPPPGCIVSLADEELATCQPAKPGGLCTAFDLRQKVGRVQVRMYLHPAKPLPRHRLLQPQELGIEVTSAAAQASPAGDSPR